jgi:membrane protease YdiL (CAAX protease family)
MTPLAAALWTIALFFVRMSCVRATEAVRPGAALDFVNLGACEALGTSALLFAVVRVHARDASLRATLGVRRPALLHILLAAAAGAGLMPVLATADALIAQRWPEEAIDKAMAEAVAGIATYGSRVTFVVVACLIVPIARELFFRGALFTEVRRATNARVAIVSTAVFFASFLPDTRKLPTQLALGLALGVLRERTGTVVTSILAHVAFVAVVGIPLLRGQDPAEDIAFPTRWIVGGAVIAGLALLAVGAGRKADG